jgi:hypothetical protein
MLSVQTMGTDLVALKHAFCEFFFWSVIRGAIQMLAFRGRFWGGDRALHSFRTVTGEG